MRYRTICGNLGFRCRFDRRCLCVKVLELRQEITFSVHDLECRAAGCHKSRRAQFIVNAFEICSVEVLCHRVSGCSRFGIPRRQMRLDHFLDAVHIIPDSGEVLVQRDHFLQRFFVSVVCLVVFLHEPVVKSFFRFVLEVHILLVLHRISGSESLELFIEFHIPDLKIGRRHFRQLNVVIVQLVDIPEVLFFVADDACCEHLGHQAAAKRSVFDLRADLLELLDLFLDLVIFGFLFFGPHIEAVGTGVIPLRHFPGHFDLDPLLFVGRHIEPAVLHILLGGIQKVLTDREAFGNIIDLLDALSVAHLPQFFDQVLEELVVDLSGILRIILFFDPAVIVGLLEALRAVQIEIVVLAVLCLLQLQERIAGLLHLSELFEERLLVSCKSLRCRAQDASLPGRNDKRERHGHPIGAADNILFTLVEEEALGIGIAADHPLALLIECILVKRDSGRCADHADPVAQIARLEVVLLLTLREHPDAALNIFAACGDRNIVSAGYRIVAVKQRLGLLRHIRHQSHRHALVKRISFLEAGAEQSFQRCVENAARLVLQIILDELSDIDVVVGPLLGFGEQFLEESGHHGLFVCAVVGEDLSERLVQIRNVAGYPGEAAGRILDGSFLELIGVVFYNSGELFKDLAGHFEPLVVDAGDSAGHIVVVADLVVADVIAQQQVAAEDLHLRAEILIPCDDEFLALSLIGARAFLLHHIIDLRRAGVRCHLRLAAALDRSALFFRDQIVQRIDAGGGS